MLIFPDYHIRNVKCAYLYTTRKYITLQNSIYPSGASNVTLCLYFIFFIFFLGGGVYFAGALVFVLRLVSFTIHFLYVIFLIQF